MRPPSRGDEVRILRPFQFLFHQHFKPDKMYVDRARQTVVVLNPKVGSTSFRHMLMVAIRDVQGRDHLSDGRYRYIPKAREFPIARIRDYVHAFNHPEAYEYYCFVRNPYGRFKSAWVDKLAFGHEQGYPRSIERRELVHLRGFAARHKLPGGESDSAIPFETFLAYVEAGATGHRNHHWDEQYSVLLMDLIRYTRLYKIETEFVAGMQHILGRVGLDDPRVLESLNAPKNKSREWPDPVYTEQLAARVYRLFARDFDVLGYDVDSWQRM